MHEGYLIAACVQSGEAVADAAGVLGDNAWAFQDPIYRGMYGACIQLWRDGVEPDLVLVTKCMQSRGAKHPSQTVIARLQELYDSWPRTENVKHYATGVRDHALARGLERVLTDMTSKAQQIVASCGDWKPLRTELDECLAALDAFERLGNAEEETPLQMKRGMDLMEWVHALRSGQLGGVSTGIDGIDRVTGRMRFGELIVVAARPSVGKSAFMGQMAYKMAAAGTPVLFMSWEMDPKMVLARIACGRSRIPLSGITNGKAPEAHIEQFTRAADDIVEMPLFITRASAMDADRAIEEARVQFVKRGIKVVFIDYLQLIGSGASGKRNERRERWQIVGEWTRKLKLLAEELNIAVVCASQLNRSKAGTSNRPELHDLRESGNIEQDADIVMMLHRDEERRESNEDGPITTDDIQAIECLVRKNRNGRIGQVDLEFVPRIMTFSADGGSPTADAARESDPNFV